MGLGALTLSSGGLFLILAGATALILGMMIAPIAAPIIETEINAWKNNPGPENQAKLEAADNEVFNDYNSLCTDAKTISSRSGVIYNQLIAFMTSATDPKYSTNSEAAKQFFSTLLEWPLLTSRLDNRGTKPAS